jgi:ADP-ribosyl-[dinitrogen reductase] hydrolase
VDGTEARAAATRLDRVAGVLLGQACGDALGVPYEFATPPGPDDLAEMRGGGLGDYAPGEWSDDTQMAVCVATVAATGADLRGEDALDRVAEGFLSWASGGATDIGAQTSAVLSAGRRGGGPAGARLAAAARAFAARHPRSAGNGALMRTSIVGLVAPADREATAEAARAVAELTHADPLAGDSCVICSEAIRAAVTTARLDVRAGLDLLPAERRGRWATWLDDAEARPSASFSPNGYTVTALQAAWSAILHTPVRDDGGATHLEAALHAAVRIGDDTDTVAAIAGGLLGGRWGASAIPAKWSSVVHGWPGLRGRDLAALASSTARRRPAEAAGRGGAEHADGPPR